MQVTLVLTSKMNIYGGGFEFLGQFSAETQTDALQRFSSLVEQSKEREGGDRGLKPARDHRERAKCGCFVR